MLGAMRRIEIHSNVRKRVVLEWTNLVLPVGRLYTPVVASVSSRKRHALDYSGVVNTIN